MLHQRNASTYHSWKQTNDKREWMKWKYRPSLERKVKLERTFLWCFSLVLSTSDADVCRRDKSIVGDHCFCLAHGSHDGKSLATMEASRVLEQIVSSVTGWDRASIRLDAKVLTLYWKLNYHLFHAILVLILCLLLSLLALGTQEAFEFILN